MTNLNNYSHPYHLVNYSPWPFTGALSVMMITMGLVNWFYSYNINILMMGYLTTLMTMYQWWRDITRESTFQGYHTTKIMEMMQWGMILFITSEIFFFISFFWSFFHSSLSPSIEIGNTWPPLSIETFNPLQIPLLNTIILLSSGITITWAHHSLLNNNNNKMTQSLFYTIFLGIYFTVLQSYEYNEAPFTIADSIYGATFFMTTGFHGLHVIIGTIFLLMCLIRHLNYHFTKIHHFGFEAATWYWHFVDVVWLFLYLSIYWWGN